MIYLVVGNQFDDGLVIKTFDIPIKPVGVLADEVDRELGNVAFPLAQGGNGDHMLQEHFSQLGRDSPCGSLVGQVAATRGNHTYIPANTGRL